MALQIRLHANLLSRNLIFYYRFFSLEIIIWKQSNPLLLTRAEKNK